MDLLQIGFSTPYRVKEAAGNMLQF